jgi:hypothetical protein
VTLNKLLLNNLHNQFDKPVSSLAMDAVVGKHSTMNVSAEFRLAQVPDTMQLKANLKDFELIGVSPYVVQATGYRFDAGQFNLALKLVTEQGEIDGKAKFRLLAAKLSTEDEALVDRLNQELTMPLPTILYLLADKKQQIKIDMPLEGNLDDPSFSFSGIMRFLSVKALKQASTYYIKTAILPQNTLFSVASLLGGMAYDKLKELPPIPFEPKQLELNKEQQELLDGFANLMLKKEKLRFRLCASSNAADAADQQAGLEIAGQREALVRNYLVEKGVPSSHLLECRAEWDEKAKKSAVRLRW